MKVTAMRRQRETDSKGPLTVGLHRRVLVPWGQMVTLLNEASKTQKQALLPKLQKTDTICHVCVTPIPGKKPL